jgi:hypothetical protein
MSECNIQTNVVENIDNEKQKCECGKLVNKKNLPAHQKTQIHLNLIKKQMNKVEEPPSSDNVEAVETNAQTAGAKIKAEFLKINKKMDDLDEKIEEILSHCVELLAIEYEYDQMEENEAKNSPHIKQL